MQQIVALRECVNRGIAHAPLPLLIPPHLAGVFTADSIKTANAAVACGMWQVASVAASTRRQFAWRLRVMSNA